MENLSDDQLEEVFRMCDSDEKGYITPTDLQALNSDPDATTEILNSLSMGPNDTLNLDLFISRVRGLNCTRDNEKVFKSDQTLRQDLFSNPAFVETSSSSSQLTPDSSRQLVSMSDIFSTADNTDLTSPVDTASKIPRFMTSSRAALTTISKSRESDFFSNNRQSDFFSPSNIGEDESSIFRLVSQSLNDLTENVIEIKKSQIESQNEFRSLLSRLSTNLHSEKDRRLDHLITLVEDRSSTKNFDQDEEKHLRCQIEKLESEKRSLHREITSLRDRVLELGNSLQIRDEELTRERRLNDELSERLERTHQELQRVNDDRQQLKTVNKALMAKVDLLTRDKNDTRSLRESLSLERMIIARDKATLAFELAALATEREKCLRRMELNNQQKMEKANGIRLNLSIEEDNDNDNTLAGNDIVMHTYRRGDEEVMSEILHNYYANSKNVGDNSTAGDKVQRLASKFEQKDGLELVSSWEEIHEY